MLANSASAHLAHMSLLTHRPTPFSPFSFFFNDTATTEIYTLSLHDALPICLDRPGHGPIRPASAGHRPPVASGSGGPDRRSEEHTSELQSRQYLVCRLLLEKKKNRFE